MSCSGEYAYLQEITFRAISPAVQTQWQNKLLELLVALRPVGAPHGNVGHVSPVVYKSLFHAVWLGGTC